MEKANLLGLEKHPRRSQAIQNHKESIIQNKESAQYLTGECAPSARGAMRPLTPDPWDTSISKRTWEKQMFLWRRQWREGWWLGPPKDQRGKGGRKGGGPGGLMVAGFAPPPGLALPLEQHGKDGAVAAREGRGRVDEGGARSEGSACRRGGRVGKDGGSQ